MVGVPIYVLGYLGDVTKNVVFVGPDIWANPLQYGGYAVVRNRYNERVQQEIDAQHETLDDINQRIQKAKRVL